MYSPQLLDHFQNPRNAGEVLNPDASVQIENPACGDILKLSIRISDDRIKPAYMLRFDDLVELFAPVKCVDLSTINFHQP